MEKIKLCKCGCKQPLINENKHVKKRLFINDKHRDTFYNRKKGLVKTPEKKSSYKINNLSCRNDVMSMECADLGYYNWQTTHKEKSKRRKAA